MRDIAWNAPGVLNLELVGAFAKALVGAVPRIEEPVGVTRSGVSDPLGYLDKAVYPPTWLPRLAEWIERWYGPNSDKLLALVAVDLAKIIVPAVGRRDFEDFAVYVYSDVDVSYFVENVLLPINGGDALASDPLYLSYLQWAPDVMHMYMLAAHNSLPLVLDPGPLTKRIVTSMAVATLGMTFKAATPGEVFKKELRPARPRPIVISLTPVDVFARRARRYLGSARFAALELEDYASIDGTEAELKAVGIRPALGLMAELAKRRRFRARDFLGLAREALEAMQEEYGVDASPYLDALEKVRLGG